MPDVALTDLRDSLAQAVRQLVDERDAAGAGTAQAAAAQAEADRLLTILNSVQLSINSSLALNMNAVAAQLLDSVQRQRAVGLSQGATTLEGIIGRIRPVPPAGTPADPGSGGAAGERGNTPVTHPPGGGSGGIADAIRSAAQQLGVDVETLASIASIESGFRVDAENPLSSAFGLFQFLDGTWADVCQRHGAALGVDVGQRRDLRAQCLMGAAFLLDNIRSLTRALGREPQPGECYAAHFFGAGTASSLLQGGRDIRADAALGNRAEAVIRANRSVFLDGGRVRTVGEVMQFFDSKMADALGKARGLLGAASTGDTDTDAGNDSDAEPEWLRIAREEIGVKEAPGDADNPRIVEYFGATTFGEHPDSVSWCGAFVSFCLREADMIDKGSARAADWLHFGDELPEPRLGCIAVLKPQAEGSSGHVGFWVEQEGGRIHLLAGNQHNEVDVTDYAETELRESGLRWPHGAR